MKHVYSLELVSLWLLACELASFSFFQVINNHTQPAVVHVFPELVSVSTLWSSGFHEPFNLINACELHYACDPPSTI